MRCVRVRRVNAATGRASRCAARGTGARRALCGASAAAAAAAASATTTVAVAIAVAVVVLTAFASFAHVRIAAAKVRDGRGALLPEALQVSFRLRERKLKGLHLAHGRCRGVLRSGRHGIRRRGAACSQD